MERVETVRRLSGRSEVDRCDVIEKKRRTDGKTVRQTDDNIRIDRQTDDLIDQRELKMERQTDKEENRRR